MSNQLPPRRKKSAVAKLIKDREQLVAAAKLVADALVPSIQDVKWLLYNEYRETLSYYTVASIRSYKKGETYLDGSNHIARVADEDGAPHWLSIILTKEGK